ncbi:C-reactive protein-like [Pelobates fuscus]|uniref:C-reactive protein-like n=1 Tax=Pelobates fuscus TaxID=191477 RepID=UPI002FE487F9
MQLQFLFIAFFMGSFAKKDLNGNVFLFPRQSPSSYVTLSSNLSRPLSKFTLCLKFYSELSSRYGLLTTSTSESESNDVFSLSVVPGSSSLLFTIGSESLYFKVALDTGNWIKTCVCFDSDSKVMQVWVNNRALVRKVASRNFWSDTQIVMSLGLLKYAGQYISFYSFLGEISDVNMWDYVLPPYSLKQDIFTFAEGNLINWSNLDFDIQGNVIVQPSLQ